MTCAVGSRQRRWRSVDVTFRRHCRFISETVDCPPPLTSSSSSSSSCYYSCCCAMTKAPSMLPSQQQSAAPVIAGHILLSFSLSLFLSFSPNLSMAPCPTHPTAVGRLLLGDTERKRKRKKERKGEREMYVVAAAAEMLERANDPCWWCGILQQFHPRLRSIVSFLFFSFLSPRPRLSLSLFLSFSLSLIPIPFLDRRMTSIHNSNSSAAHSQGQNLVTELCCCCYCCWLMCVAETL